MADRNALSRATESTDSPTPGYLYNDIAKTVSISPIACTETISYLINKLTTKNNVNVKYKCLKVIQMVCQNPNARGLFKRSVCQDVSAVSAIKECLNFRGPMDPIHGDKMYQKVRDQARDTLDAIYSDFAGEVNKVPTNQYSQQYPSAISSSSTSMSSNSMSNAPRKMEGIGNPMFKDPRIASNTEKGIGEMTVTEVLSAAKEGFAGIIKDPLARNVPNPPSHNWNNPPPGQRELSYKTGGQWTMATNRGPNAISSDSFANRSSNSYNHNPHPHFTPSSSSSSSQTFNNSSVGGSWGSPANTSSSIASQSRAAARYNTSHTNHGKTGPAASDGTYERNLILELCPAGGMKAEPPPDKLHNFIKTIPSLNPDLICPALLDALEDGQPWIIRAKALCVMEAAIVEAEKLSQETGNSNSYADFFHACSAEIEPLANHTRVAVRDPARRVLKALGLETDNMENYPPHGSSTSNATGFTANQQPQSIAAPIVVAPNLLDFDNDEPTNTDDIPPPPSDLPPSLPDECPPPPPTINSNVNNKNNDSSSLFGGMNMKEKSNPPSNNPATVAAPVVTVPVSSVPDDSYADLLGGPVVVSNDAVANEDTILSETSTNIPSKSSADASSAFSFINNAESTPAPSSSNQSSSNNQLSFDPLYNTSSSSSKSQQQLPMMSNPQMMTPAQQQYLMMQMQMQQMQLNGNPARFMMMQQLHQQGSSNSSFQNASSSIRSPSGGMMMMGQPTKQVMGGANGGGVTTSFAFMEDPAKVKKEASNKKFDFVQDAMKSAR